jgi:nicotinamidase/pyrazinamidase
MSQEAFSFHDGDALLLVDVQNDFLPGGALPVPEGDKILPVLNEWIEKAVAGGARVYASRDWHPQGHLSFREAGGQWPPHCVQDTEGARFAPDMVLPADAVVVTKGVRFDQDQYSAFDQTGLARRLEKDGIRRLVVGGLALDVCVNATVMDARKLGFEVFVIEKGTKAVDGGQVIPVFTGMIKAGVKIVGEDLDVCVTAPEFAEHQRLHEEEDACDDGRGGSA